MVVWVQVYYSVIKSNGSFWSYSRSDPGSFILILFLSGCIQFDFRVGPFSHPKFWWVFRLTSFYTVMISNKKIFWLVRCILCSFIDNKKFSWLPWLIYAVFIANKSFSGLTYFLARFTDLFYLETLKHNYLSILIPDLIVN